MDDAKLLLRDYAYLLREMLEAERPDEDFARGRRLGIYEAFSLLVSQVDSFGVTRDDLGLRDTDPDALL